MSKTNIPEKIKTQLWTLSGGRCEYEGCNIPLWQDDLAFAKMNRAYIAHIIADSVDGPRGDKILSKKLAKDFDNLMILCDTHHRKIDIEEVDEHPAEKLQEMKRAHERRIELLTSINPEKKSHVVFYGANIGKHGFPLNFKDAVQALIPRKYPEKNYPVELSIKNSPFTDHETKYWDFESDSLERQFKEKVSFLKTNSEIQHYSLFGLAPMPLLIKLGTLYSDLFDVEVYQRHKEPSSWVWQDVAEIEDFELIKPSSKNKLVALNLSLSATITEDRIKDILGEDISIWTITHKNPNNDFLKTKDLLSKFRKISRHAFNQIKAIHGQNTELHVFPAMPVSSAIEFGRVWMPKADMPLIIYDQNKTSKGFMKTLTIK